MLQSAGVKYNDYLFGMVDSGSMTLDLILKIIKNLPAGVTEIYFHPAARRCKEIERTMAHYRHEEEYRALTSTKLAEAIQRAGITRIAFCDI